MAALLKVLKLLLLLLQQLLLVLDDGLLRLYLLLCLSCFDLEFVAGLVRLMLPLGRLR